METSNYHSYIPTKPSFKSVVFFPPTLKVAHKSTVAFDILTFRIQRKHFFLHTEFIATRSDKHFPWAVCPGKEIAVCTELFSVVTFL